MQNKARQSPADVPRCDEVWYVLSLVSPITMRRRRDVPPQVRDARPPQLTYLAIRGYLIDLLCVTVNGNHEAGQ